MSKSLSCGLAAILFATMLAPAVSQAQVIMSFSDDDPSYPIAVAPEVDRTPVVTSLSDNGINEEFVCCDTCYVPRNWISADYLLWWTKGNSMPPLVTTSPAGTAQGDAGVLPGATTLFGGEQIDNEYRNGLRATVVHWSDAEGTVGWQATYTGLFDDDSTGDYFNRTTGTLGAGVGSPILARPFFNTSLGVNDALLISFPGLVDGDVTVNASSELHSISWMVRQHYHSGCRGRVDLIGGYRYFRFREGLQIRNNLVITDVAGLVPNGTTIAIEDTFLAENDFHGGDLGIVAEFWRDSLTLEVLAKVALGNIRRSADVYGTSVTDTPPAGGATTTSGGLLALPTNIGHRAANDFAALPELGVNLRFQPKPNVTVNVGYSLVMLTDVIRTGELIDSHVNATQLFGGALVGPRDPASQFAHNTTDFWAQGLNIGLTISR